MSNTKEIPDELLNKGNEKEIHIKPKTGMKDMHKKPEYAKKRVYDKHSGTGRGKEIAKSGGGGKFTWGTNDQALEKEAIMDDDDDNYEEEYQEKEQQK